MDKRMRAGTVHRSIQALRRLRGAPAVTHWEQFGRMPTSHRKNCRAVGRHAVGLTAYSGTGAVPVQAT